MALGGATVMATFSDEEMKYMLSTALQRNLEQVLVIKCPHVCSEQDRKKMSAVMSVTTSLSLCCLLWVQFWPEVKWLSRKVG